MSGTAVGVVTFGLVENDVVEFCEVHKLEQVVVWTDQDLNAVIQFGHAIDAEPTDADGVLGRIVVADLDLCADAVSKHL